MTTLSQDKYVDNDPPTLGPVGESDDIWPIDTEDKEIFFRENLIYLKTYDLLIKEEDLLPLVKKQLKEKIKMYKEFIAKKIQQQREWPEDRAKLDEERLALVAQQKRYQYRLNFLEGKVDFTTSFFDNKLIRARAVPIPNFIKINHAGFASCLWHNEDTPSMKYYPKNNKVHCFGCGAGGDVVDVVGKIYGLDFKQALAYILNDHK
jgi:hypothetical protein